MRLSRVASLSLVIVVAVPWAATLTVGGLWLALTASVRWPQMAPALISAGIAAIAAGQLVFAVCVADRCFPRVSRSLGAAIEIVALAALVAGIVVLMWLFVGGLLAGSVA